MQDCLKELLDRNNIFVDDFMTETYECMIVSIFEVIADELKDHDFCNETRKRLLNSSNKALTMKNIVYEKTKCKLSDSESKDIYKYVYAFLTKTNNRISYDQRTKRTILERQNGKCNICKKDIIDKTDNELDHIIPWAYVGDELGVSNLQMLCMDCNRHKSKNSAYNLKMFLINK